MLILASPAIILIKDAEFKSSTLSSFQYKEKKNKKKKSFSSNISHSGQIFLKKIVWKYMAYVYEPLIVYTSIYREITTVYRFRDT